LFGGDRNISALAAEFAPEMLPADSTNATTGGALHGGNERAGVIHWFCLQCFGLQFRLSADG
jgi:hypothetical protein